jgi:hypothetical protein
MTIKLFLLVVMCAIAIVRSRRSDQPDEAGKAGKPDKTNLILMAANLFLGMVVLLLSGYMDSVGAMMLAGM